MSVVLVHFALALLASSLGFRRLVYFVSLGYGFSMVAQALITFGFGFAQLTPVVLLQVVLLGVYGARLSSYLIRREKSPAYQRELADVQKRGANIDLGRQVLIWVGVSTLYVCMYSPALATFAVRAEGLVPAIGVSVMALGLALETLADRQKDLFKRSRPDDYCDVGLYRLSRCPNYLGEVVFWLGNFVAGLTAYQGLWSWLGAVIGTVCIVLIMMGSTKRQEAKQDARYGGRDAYRAWVRRVPVLFPFIPLYSLKNVRVYLE